MHRMAVGLAVAGGTLLLAAATPVEARKARSTADCRLVRGERVCARPARTATRETSQDRVRADSVDPAREFGALPDWARWSLAVGYTF